MAEDSLQNTLRSTLLIVGEKDYIVIKLNQSVMLQMNFVKELKATHLFEESNTLEEATLLAKDWFITYLTKDK